MKKLQIIAGMLSVLLLVGCGGTGVFPIRLRWLALLFLSRIVPQKDSL